MTTLRLHNPATLKLRTATRPVLGMALSAVDVTRIDENRFALRPAPSASFPEALANTEEAYPAEMFSLGSMFGFDDGNATVITNRDRYYGAVGILFPSVQRELRKMYGDRFIILPSSVHEVLAIPDTGDYPDAVGMVKAINRAEVAPEERLADTAFLVEFKGQEMTLTDLETAISCTISCTKPQEALI